MDRRTALAVLSASAALALAGDYLFRASEPGIGLSVLVALFVAAALVVDGVRGGLERSAAPWLAAAFVFGAFLGLRDTPQLQAWNVLAVLGCAALALLAGRRLAIGVTPLEAYVRPAFRAAGSVLVAPFLALRPSVGATPDSSTPLLPRILLATVVTVPLLLLFGSLFTSADPVFERLIREMFAWDIERVASHIVTIGVLGWLAAGYLIASRTPDTLVAEGERRRPFLGFLEVGVPLVALALLFTAFVALQFRYLFGGADLIRSTVGLTVAEYARRGFFELIAASGLVIPLVVVADWLLRGSAASVLRRFRLIAALLLGLVVCIMASALGRLLLYYESFGLTTDRVLALAVMVWVGLTLAWTAATVLRGAPGRFPAGAVLGGLGVLATLNLVNPQAIVARANIGRRTAGASLDVTYLAKMSADAVPTILAHVRSLPDDERCPLLTELARRYGAPDKVDWRAWNLSRQRARDALDGRSTELRCTSENRGTDVVGD